MKKLAGLIMIVLPVAAASVLLARYLNGGQLNVVTLIAAAFIGAVYLLIALSLLRSED